MADALTAGAYAPRRRPLFSRAARPVLLALLTAYFAGLVLWPLGRLLAQAFIADGSISLDIVYDQWVSASAQRALRNTLEASFLSALLSVVLGTAAAAIVGLTDIRGKSLAVFLLFLPLLVPSQITALAWIELTASGSPIMVTLGLGRPPGSTNPLYSEGGIILVMGVEHAGLVFLTVRAAFRDLPQDLVEAARLSGAKPRRIFRSVLIPLALPAILSGGALAFVGSIGNFGVPALLGIPGRYPMLSTLIYQRLQGFGVKAIGEVAALALALALLAGAGLVLRGLLARHASAPANRGSARLSAFPLGRGRPWVEAGLWSMLVLVSVLPLIALVSASIVPALGVPLGPATATLQHYHFLIFGYDPAHRAFVNSFGLALAAAATCILVAIPLAYLAVSDRSRLARILDAVADIPYAVPGAVVGIAAIIAFLPPLPIVGFSLYNTGWIILIAYLARFLVLAQRPIVAALESLDPSLDEAARASGAGIIFRLRRVVLPLVGPTAAAGGVLIFIQASNELTVSALLWSTGWETLGTLVFSLYREGNSSAASALATLSLFSTLALAGAISLFGRRLPVGVIPWRA